jgi:hypothetical protein
MTGSNATGSSPRTPDYTVGSAEGQRVPYEVASRAELAFLLASRAGAAQRMASAPPAR